MTIQIHTWYFRELHLQVEKITKISFSAQLQAAMEWVTSRETMQHIEGIIPMNVIYDVIEIKWTRHII